MISPSLISSLSALPAGVPALSLVQVRISAWIAAPDGWLGGGLRLSQENCAAIGVNLRTCAPLPSRVCNACPSAFKGAANSDRIVPETVRALCRRLKGWAGQRECRRPQTSMRRRQADPEHNRAAPVVISAAHLRKFTIRVMPTCGSSGVRTTEIRSI